MPTVKRERKRESTNMTALESVSNNVADPAVVEEVSQAIREIKAEELAASIYKRMEHTDGIPGDEGDLTVTSTGKVRLFHADTGREKYVLKDQLVPVLKKKFTSGPMVGQSAFSDVRRTDYKLGQVKCFLHPEHDDRETVEKLGLGHITCTKATLATSRDAKLHAEHRHKSEYAAYKEYADKLEREEDRQLQRRQLEIMTAMMEKNIGFEA